MVTTKLGAYPHTDDGVEARRIYHKLRSKSNESFDVHCKSRLRGARSRFPPEGSATTMP